MKTSPGLGVLRGKKNKFGEERLQKQVKPRSRAWRSSPKTFFFFCFRKGRIFFSPNGGHSGNCFHVFLILPVLFEWFKGKHEGLPAFLFCMFLRGGGGVPQKNTHPCFSCCLFCAFSPSEMLRGLALPDGQSRGPSAAQHVAGLRCKAALPTWFQLGKKEPKREAGFNRNPKGSHSEF